MTSRQTSASAVPLLQDGWHAVVDGPSFRH
jgi:hypothetical protein